MKRLLMPIAFALVVSACGLNEHGPWLDWNGNELRGSDIVEYEGFAICDQTQVLFIRFFGDLYAKDPSGTLGRLESLETGATLSFEVFDTVPDGLQGTEITHAGREIYVGEDRSDYLYVRLPTGQTERWPRAEDTCQREEPLG